MPEPGSVSSGLLSSVKRLFGTSLAVLQNRAELFTVEFQEEKHRQIEVLVLAGSALLLGFLGICLLTTVVIFLFPAGARLYVAAGLGVLYGLGAVLLLTRVKGKLQTQPFAETINQIKKDVECLTPPK
jgi:uncharacterized membrane protein YqjE